MIVGTLPSLINMMGPYVLARRWRFLCGRFPSMWRFPIIGRARGPGGRFRPFLLWFREDERKM